MRVTHGACGKEWTQKGNKSGHCDRCHETYYGITAFDAHQHHKDGQIVCRRVAVTEKGREVPWWQDDDGQWHMGARMTEEQKRKAGWVS